MKQMIRRLSRVGDSSQYESLRGKEGGRAREEVPEGHVPVYVGEGEEVERFVVRAELLSRPAFVELLRRSAQEYGYEQRGVLRIPCPVAVFRRVLRSLLAASAAEAEAELLRSFDEEFLAPGGS
ncbi:auxin-responsive protein SAUR71-like [Phoenix dactylifera]|uniref:Auxin-responsive protein SAUR71-like n=1 Tax=Phoenix dactylifera TaxID=42345 RepID=A0A8B7BXD6_PHODC|nr:auxin-responsive protein SAUR71-like [Phoenix dactylifera]